MPRRVIFLAFAALSTVLGTPVAWSQGSPIGQAGTRSGCVAAVHLQVGNCRYAPGLLGPTSGVLSADGEHLYVASPKADRILTLRRDPGGAAVRYSRCIGTRTPRCADVPGLQGVSKLAISADGTRVAALSPASRSLVVLVRERGNGVLRFDGCAAQSPSIANATKTCSVTRALNGATALAISPDGLSVYVALGQSSTIQRFDVGRGSVTRATGSGACVVSAAVLLRPSTSGCVVTPGLHYPLGVMVSPDGRNVYAVASRDGSVVGLRRSTLSGAMSRQQCIASERTPGCSVNDTLAGASGLTIGADGADVYVAAPAAAAITSLARDPNGRLQSIGCLSGSPSFRTRCREAPLLLPMTLARGAAGYVFAGDPAGRSVAVFLAQPTGDLVVSTPVRCLTSDSTVSPQCASARRIGKLSDVVGGAASGVVYAISADADAVVVLAPQVPTPRS